MRVNLSVQNVVVVAFFIGTLLHVALRMAVKVRKARLRLRGDVQQAPLFGWMFAGYFVSLLLSLLEWTLSPWPFQWSVAVVGLAFTAASMFLQYRAFYDLGPAYSPDIEIRQEHRLVRSGIYGFIRHPLLASLLLELWGVTLFMNAYATSLLVGIFYVPVVLYRKREEEKALCGHFGELYRVYSQEVGGLFPKRFA
jgi:protein-S-isoprenylcysteine O-methyltransferase Ste14